MSSLSIVFVLWQVWAAEANALIERRAWLFEQLGAPPLPTVSPLPRYQVSIQNTHYQDQFSTQASGILDLRLFEIGLKASRRISLGLSRESTAIDNAMGEDRTYLSAEIARYYMALNRHFGRLGIEYFEGIPAQLHWLRIGLQTGVLATAGSPWGFNLHSQFFWSLSAKPPFVLIRGEIDRTLSDHWAAGGLIGWTYRRNNDPGTNTIWEYQSFIVGPFLKWVMPLGSLQLETNIRWWIDRERIATPSGEAIESPSELHPVLSLRAWFPL